jgi:hypothetical protein
VKLTARGRDYFQATIILALLSMILDANVLLALALTLAIVAVVCFLIVRSVSEFNTVLVFDPPRLSAFKGEEGHTKVHVQLLRDRWVTAGVKAIESPSGVESKFTISAQNTVSISVKTRYAGRFEGFAIRLQVTDILNMFSKEIATLYSDFRLDSLPVSLLAPIPTSKPMPLTLGERSSRSPGSSLELYALDQYQPYSETKNVLWKRVARMPDERLIVRIRESSIPRLIRVGFIAIDNRFRDLTLSDKEDQQEAVGTSELFWKDMTCETLGAIGNLILALGCDIEISHTGELQERPGIVSETVNNFGDLAGVIMNLWEAPENGDRNEKLFEVIAMSDIIICGMRDLADESVASAVARKPALVISEKWTEPAYIGKQAFVYTGIEDLKQFVVKVVDR